MAYKNRTDLTAESLVLLGIISQSDSSAPRTRVELVSEIAQCLGIVQQSTTGTPRTRVDLVSEAYGNLGFVYQADAGTPRTRVELVNEVSFILGPGAVGQTLSGDDYAAIDLRVDTVIADLNERVIATVANPNAIPAAWFDDLVILVANACADKFGLMGDEAVKLTARAQMAEQKLKTVNRSGLIDEEVLSVLADLAARRIVTIINANSIPTQWFPHIATILADSAKGKFELSPETMKRLSEDCARAEFLLKTTTRLDLIDEKLDSICGELNARGIAAVPTPVVTVPGAWYAALADIVAEGCRTKFDVSPDTAKIVIAKAQIAERKLKNLYFGPILLDRNIDSILSELAADEIIYLVDVEQIPDEWFQSLAMVVADKCKGKLDVDPAIVARVMAEGPVAMQTLRRITRGRPSYLTMQSAYF